MVTNTANTKTTTMSMMTTTNLMDLEAITINNFKKPGLVLSVPHPDLLASLPSPHNLWLEGRGHYVQVLLFINDSFHFSSLV